MADLFQTPYEGAQTNELKSDDLISNQTVNISDVQLLNQRATTNHEHDWDKIIQAQSLEV